MLTDGFDWDYVAIGASATALALLGLGATLTRGRHRRPRARPERKPPPGANAIQTTAPQAPSDATSSLAPAAMTEQQQGSKDA